MVEDTELDYLVHFATPIVRGYKSLIPKGTVFAQIVLCEAMLYMHLVVDNNDEILEKMREQVKANYENLFTRQQGFTFFITDEQLQTLPL